MGLDEFVSHTGRSLLLEDGGTPLPAHVQAGLAVGVVVIVAIAGVMSGLTLGLLSMDRLDLELMLRTGSKKQERMARRLGPIISQPHWVLSTLVICNTAAGMALPLCLDRLVNVAVALVLSTTAIVLFGEILPQAVCSRYGLSIGGHAAPVVRFLMWFTAPISWPIGKALDALLGHEQPTFGKRQISALVDLHRESAGMGGPLNEEEAHVIQGVLDLSSKTGSKAMTPLDKVFMVSTDDVLDRPTLKRILDSGHSRVPVCRGGNRSDIIGLILVKELLAVVGLSEPGSGPVRVKDLRIRDLPTLPVETPMTDLLNLFQTGHSHMALLLQKQDDASKDGEAPTITAVASCSSSSEGGSTPVHAGSRSSSASPPGSKPSKVAALLRSLSSKTLGRSTSKKDASGAAPLPEPGHTTIAVHAGGLAVAAAAAAPAVGGDRGVDADLMEAGTLPQSPVLLPPHMHGRSEAHDSLPSLSRTAGPSAAAAAAAMPHSASAPGPLGRAGAPGVVVAAAAAGGALARLSPGVALARPSAASVWRDAGWEPSVGVPVGVITLEDVLEELMQEEIVDETDAFIDNEKTCKVNARVLAMSLPPGLRRLLLTSQQLQAQRQSQHQQQQHPSTSPHTGFGSSPALVSAGSTGALAGIAAAGAGANPGGVGRSSQTGGAAQARGSMSILGSAAGAAGGSKQSQQAVWPATVG